MPSLKQVSFSGGHISDQLLGRTDQEKYVAGVRECTNAIIQRFGGLQNRSGTEYIDNLTTISGGSKVRLIKFVFNFTNAYQLVFSTNNIRPYKNGAQVRVDIADTTPWSNATNYVVGNIANYGGTVFICRTANINQVPVTGTYWFELITDIAGLYLVDIPVNNSSFSFPQASLATLQTAQLNDVMRITSQLFTPLTLTRFSDVDWTLEAFVPGAPISPPNPIAVVAGFGVPGIGIPGALAAVGGDAGLPAFSAYQVTAYTATGEGQPQSVAIHSTVGRPSIGFPVVLTWNAVAGAVGYVIYRHFANGGQPALLAVTQLLTYTDPGLPVECVVKLPPSGTVGNITFTYEVTSIDSTTGAESEPSAPVSALGNTPDGNHPNVISWAAVTGASSYRVYRIVNGVPGFIGEQPSSPFYDTNFLPDYSQQPPEPIPLFQTSSDWPACCAYYQQRLCFANTINQPNTIWMSRTGTYTDFSIGTPVVDTDALTFTIAGKFSQPITSLVDLGKLIIHTESAEYIASGNVYGTITPTATNVVQQSGAGSQLLYPVVLGNTDVFVQSRGTQLRDLQYSIQSTSYVGKDLSIFAGDYFNGHSVVDMDWQNIKDSVIWVVLDNGTLLGLTYIREQNTWAWHKHTFSNGFVENVCVVSTGTEDVTSFVVRRTIGGTTVRYLETLTVRDYLDTVLYSDALIADSCLVYDGRNVGSVTMTPSTSGGWTTADVITLTASGSEFLAGDVGNQIVFQKYDAITGLVTDQVSFNIVGYTSGTVVTTLPLRDVPTWARVALLKWGKAVKTFTGMDHLTSENISVLADGNVVASPLNPKYPLITVAGDTFVLPVPALVVCAGLPIQMDAQTMPVENAQGATISNKQISVRECCPVFYNSRGGLYGQDKFHLFEWKQPLAQPPATPIQGYPVQPWSGPAIIPIQGTPQPTGQVWIRVVDPVPWAMSGIVIDCEVGK